MKKTSPSKKPKPKQSKALTQPPIEAGGKKRFNQLLDDAIFGVPKGKKK